MAADINSLKTMTQQILREIAKQAMTLSIGLENAAPPSQSGTNKSALYLSEIATVIEELLRTLDDLTPDANDNGEQHLKLNAWVKESVRQDDELRDKYLIVDKFKFVRDRLRALLADLESQIEVQVSAGNKTQSGLAEDEVTVHVYLFNSQGLEFHSWRGMLTPKLFYEYSVNRPIYSEKAHIESLARSKTNPIQHAYLSVVIKQKDILQSGDAAPKDAMGHSVLKVREGSLRFENLITFTHNDQDYIFSEEKGLVKKTPPAELYI